MGPVPISDARKHLGDIGNSVAYGGERVVVERRGRNLFAIVPMEDYALIKRLEDEADLALIRERLDEPGEPWEKVKKELGL